MTSGGSHCRQNSMSTYSTNTITVSVQQKLLETRLLLPYYRPFLNEGTVEPRRTGGSASSKVSDDVLQYIEISKLRKPSVFAREIREQIVLEGVCDLDESSSESAILWSARNKLGMTWKRISQQPREATTLMNTWKTCQESTPQISNFLTKVQSF